MNYILILTLAIVIATMSYGLVQKYKNDVKSSTKIRKALKINLAAFIPVISAGIITMIPQVVSAAAETGANSAEGLGYISAALSTGLAAIGAGYAVGAVGSSALGAVSEDQSILGKTLIFVGLAEGIAIYGLIISIMILTRL